ncbi:MAG TPA: hypothetical protein PK257_02665 [Candidatus Woesebacteria bacterium]|nr:hypothetical protein [Candidatus Woesebacteria bacterium]
MTDHDRNMRTLVLCFVLAIMALIPLRVIEYSQDVSEVSSTQVLGETVQQQLEIVLPNGELNVNQLNYGDEITEKDLLY